MNYPRLLALLFSAAFLAACGGGGGDSPPAVASTRTFNLKAAYVNYLQTSTSRNFNISGSLNGVTATGSGSITKNALQPSTFQNIPALVMTLTTNGTVNVLGQSAPYGGINYYYFDTNYNPLGNAARAIGSAVDSSYSVVTSSIPLPTAAKVNDSGIWWNSINYPNSMKSYSTGTTTMSYSVSPDTDSSAILTLLSTLKGMSGATIATSEDKFRITTNNGVTQISGNAFLPSSGLLTFIFE